MDTQRRDAGKASRKSPGIQRECRALDAAILESEQAERRMGAAMMEGGQQDLFSLRKRYRTLGC